MSAPAGQPAPGDRVDDRYELVEPLPDYGLGEAWQARDARYKNRLVVVKFLRAVPDGGVPEPLARHLKSLRSLRHPNVLAVVNTGRWGNRPYLVTEFFTGASLGTGLDKARATGELLPAALLSGLFDRICAGLEASHQTRPSSVLHLGLNPGSVLIHRAPGQDFEVRVLDHGLAPWADRAPDAPVRSARALVSSAPEQYGAATGLGPTTDVFALGELLREMLAMPPDPGETLAPAGMHRRRTDVPRGLWAVIDRATEMKPADRYASVAALQAAARATWAEPVTPPASNPPPGDTRRPVNAAPPAPAARPGPPDLTRTAVLPTTDPRNDPRASSPFGPMPVLPAMAPGLADDLSRTVSLADQPRNLNPWDVNEAVVRWYPEDTPLEVAARPSRQQDDFAATLVDPPEDDGDDLSATTLPLEDARPKPPPVVDDFAATNLYEGRSPLADMAPTTPRPSRVNPPQAPDAPAGQNHARPANRWDARPPVPEGTRTLTLEKPARGMTFSGMSSGVGRTVLVVAAVVMAMAFVVLGVVAIYNATR